MIVSSRSRPIALGVIALVLMLFLVFVGPSQAHAAAPGPFRPLQIIPGWLEEALEELVVAIQIELVKVLQDSARVGGVLLWGVLKVCGMVGLFGNDFSTLFGTVVTEALNAVVTGSVHDLIRGSLMVSLGIFGLSLLVRPFWPDVRLVSFQRAAVWGLVIQAYLVGAPTIYTELETWRVDLSEEVASAVSSGAIPGCSGSVVEVLLCITGTSPAEVLDPDLSALPDQIPYGGSESVHDLYDHCIYNPPVLYPDPACDPDNPVGDPWDVLPYAQDALGTQLLGIILACLILAYGVLQIALGLAAGMMFVLFPVAAIFAFYLPLESFPAGVIRNYINIFLKSVVLLTLAGVVIRLFSVAAGGPGGGNLAAMAAVGLVDLLLCFIMAKEALASLLGAISFVGSSVSTLGATVGLTGSAGVSGSPAPASAAVSHTASTMMTRSSMLQTLMGSPGAFDGAGSTVLGSAGSALGAPLRAGQAAAQAVAAAGSGGAGLVAGLVAGAKGADYGSLALMGSGLTSTFGPDVGRGFMTGAGAVAAKELLQGKRGRASGRQEGADSGQRPKRPSPSGGDGPKLLVPPTRPLARTSGPQASSGGTRLSPLDPHGDEPPALAPLQAGLQSSGAGPSASSGQAPVGWTPESTRRIQDAATRLAPASTEVQNSAYELLRASHRTAQQWAADGRSPILDDGRLDPQFVEDTIEQAPAAAEAFVAGQAESGMPAEERLALDEAIALGVATEQTIPGREVQRGFGRALKAMGQDGDLDTALREQLGIGVQDVFGQEAPRAQAVAAQMQGAGLGNEQGRQLVETVQEELGRNRRLTPQQFREGSGYGRTARMRQWDRASGDPEVTDRIVEGLIGLGPIQAATVRDIPTVGDDVQAPSAPSGTATAHVADAPAVANASAPSTSSPGYDSALYDQLRTWRTETASQGSQKPFQVFPNATLERIAAARPQTMDELAAVKGVGPKRLERYGEAVLGITRSTSEGDAPAQTEASAAPADNVPSHDVPAVRPSEAPTPVATTPAPVEAGDEGYDPALFDRLRTWRLTAAGERDLKPFYVFSDATLKQIASARPSSLEELGQVKGIGPKKLEQYGPAVLGILAAHPKREGEQS